MAQRREGRRVTRAAARRAAAEDAARAEQRARRKLIRRLDEILLLRFIDREVDQLDTATLAGVLAFARYLMPPDPALGLPAPPFMGSLGEAIAWEAAPWC